MPEETVVNMFAGIGCFSIMIAKYACPQKIFSIDINSVAVQYAKCNVKLNAMLNVVEVIKGDAKDVIMKEFRNKANRVIMPLPGKAYEYLKYAVMALKHCNGFIHYYDFIKIKGNENPVEKSLTRVSERLKTMHLNFSLLLGKVVRTVGPKLFQIVIDVSISK